MRLPDFKKLNPMSGIKNLFNTEQWAGVNATITTDANGNPVAPLPTSADQLTPNNGYEQRQLQIGFKFTF